MGDVAYIALLRGVNIGRGKRVAMADLRALVERMGYRGARTVLNSGNIAFTGVRMPAAQVARGLEQAIVDALEVQVQVIVLTASELAAAAAANPLLDRASDLARLVLAVPADLGDLRRLDSLLARDWAPEALAVGPRAAYCWCPNGFLESPVAESVRQALGDSATMRNWATVAKLLALAKAVRASRDE